MDNKKINIAELLKGCPKGMELDCTICNGSVTLEDIIEFSDFPIRVVSKSGFHHRFTKHGSLYNDAESKCVIFPKGKDSWEGFTPPVMFKDGDVVCDGRWIGITSGGISGKFIPTYCVLTERKELRVYPDYREEWVFNRLATEREKKKLFSALGAAGYVWNAEKKKLENMPEPKKFDPGALKSFDKVLVRTDKCDIWECDFFSSYSTDRSNRFHCIGAWYDICIPFEGNEHLLGTTDDCADFYKTWED